MIPDPGEKLNKTTNEFSSYRAYWMNYATILISSSGIFNSYPNAPTAELHNAL
jgi:succinate-acetate transporter protein